MKQTNKKISFGNVWKKNTSERRERGQRYDLDEKKTEGAKKFVCLHSSGRTLALITECETISISQLKNTL